jgi:hypothetical protein
MRAADHIATASRCATNFVMKIRKSKREIRNNLQPQNFECLKRAARAVSNISGFRTSEIVSRWSFGF